MSDDLFTDPLDDDDALDFDDQDVTEEDEDEDEEFLGFLAGGFAAHADFFGLFGF